MTTYALFKIGKSEQHGETRSILMSDSNIDSLRANANAVFAAPDNFVGRPGVQLHIPGDQLLSNIVQNNVGNDVYARYIEIREVNRKG